MDPYSCKCKWPGSTRAHTHPPPRALPPTLDPPSALGRAQSSTHLLMRVPLCCLLGATIAGAAVVAEPSGYGSKPHILLVLVDDLGWHNVGWHNKDMLTPHSDELLREGLELDRHYTYMYCAPTRSSLLSGRLPYHVNQIILSNDGAIPDWGVPKEMTLLPQKLKSGETSDCSHFPQATGHVILFRWCASWVLYARCRQVAYRIPVRGPAANQPWI